MTATEVKRSKMKWQPKKWRPEYERMVAMSCLGWSNKMIAERAGYTPEHVSNVLNLPQAEHLREQLLERMREQTLKSIPERLDEIAEHTLKRLHTVVTNDELFEKSPFAVVDRGMDVVKGLGHLKGGGNGAPGINVSSAIIIQGEQAEGLFASLEKAREVRRIHGTPEADRQ